MGKLTINIYKWPFPITSYVSLPEGISSVMISNYTHIYITHIPPSAPGAGPSTCAAPATRRGPWPGPNRTLASLRMAHDLWVDLWVDLPSGNLT
jgi:hypothetical protein